MDSFDMTLDVISAFVKFLLDTLPSYMIPNAVPDDSVRLLHEYGTNNISDLHVKVYEQTLSCVLPYSPSMGIAV